MTCKMKRTFYIFLLAVLSGNLVNAQTRTILDFNNDWKFWLGDTAIAKDINYNDNNWRSLSLPHDWSIEGEFSDKHPGTPNQAALPTGIAWYRKTFTLPANAKDKKVTIEFDGIYRNSEVWVNGH